MALHSEVKVLSPEEMDRVHQGSLKVLEETGVVFHSDEALEIFKENDFKVEGKTVFFSATQVEKALEQAPPTYEFCARNPEHTVSVGSKKHLLQPAFGCVFVQEPGKERRKGTLQDYINYQRLVQGSDLIQLAGGVPIVADEIDPDVRHLHQMYASLKYTDKPLIGWAATQRQTNEMLDLMEIAYGGKEVLESRYVLGSGINPLSPLSYSTETLECVIANAKRNQVLLITPAAMAGITAPIDVLGTALLQNAETLACIVLIQLIKPGLPVVYAPASVAGYMKRASFCTGSPESILINLVSLQLARDLYKIPTRTLTGHTDAKVPDYQAGMETMQSLLLSCLGGAEILTQSLGTLESYMTISFEKFILDEEMFSRAMRIHQGMDTSNLDETIALIQEVASSGNYLTHPSTFKKFRDCWQPIASDWQDHDSWYRAGGKDAVEMAHEIYEARMAQEPETFLDETTEKAILDYIKQAEASRK
ncbi:MAG: trimethylamine methyltransferase family protein [Desulfobacterales bacterium]|nr:trimethylamine methyltransferase family protein [Desulfobacterales bacterium]